jgi:integrase
VSDLTERFCKHHHSFNDITHSRACAQRRTLARFEAAIGKPAVEVTPKDFEQWMADEIARGLKASTVVTNANMVRPFFTWCWREGLIDADTLMRFREAPLPRVEEPEPRPYSRKELRRFWSEFDEGWPKIDPKFWGRWRRGTSPWRRVWVEAMRVQLEAVIALALDCGLRQFEIYLAAIDDIHPDNEYVVVQKGKGRKYREVPHTDASRLAVHRWLTLRDEIIRRFGVEDHGFTWLVLDPRATRTAADIDAPRGSNPTHKMGQRRFSLLMCRIGSGWEFHRFRHTCGTEWLRAGVPLELVSKLLGHSDLEMTRRYTKIIKQDVSVAMTKAAKQFQSAVRPDQEAA